MQRLWLVILTVQLMLVARPGLDLPEVAGVASGAPVDPVLRVRPAEATTADISAATPLASPLELHFLDLTNIDRARNGLPAVENDPSILGVARARAAAQVGGSQLNHYEPDGEMGLVRLLNATGIEYVLAGENLGRWTGTGDVAERIEATWMGSPMHRENILQPVFTRLAVGTATDASGQLFVAAVFRAVP